MVGECLLSWLQQTRQPGWQRATVVFKHFLGIQHVKPVVCVFITHSPSGRPTRRALPLIPPCTGGLRRGELTASCKGTRSVPGCTALPCTPRVPPTEIKQSTGREQEIHRRQTLRRAGPRMLPAQASPTWLCPFPYEDANHRGPAYQTARLTHLPGRPLGLERHTLEQIRERWKIQRLKEFKIQVLQEGRSRLQKTRGRNKSCLQTPEGLLLRGGNRCRNPEFLSKGRTSQSGS